MQAPSRPVWTQRAAPLLIVGAAHSGKSEFAMQCLAPDQPTIVIGTAPPSEPAFARRLGELQALRPGAWESTFAGTDLVAALAEAAGRYQQVMVDAVSQWLAMLLLTPDPEADMSEDGRSRHLEAQVAELEREIRAHPLTRFVLVTAEVGGGPAPSRNAERIYRQQVGLTNQRLARLAATVVTLQAGIPSIIKG